MGTLTAVTDQSNTSTALPIKRENVDAVVAAKLVEGKIKSPRMITSVKETYKLKGLSEDGKKEVPYTGDEQIFFEQTYIKPSVGTEEGFKELIPNLEARLDIINRGIANKLSQKIRTKLTETDEAETSFVFQPIEGAYDPTSDLQEPPQRSSLSAGEKIMNQLTSLSDDEKAKLFALLQSMGVQQQG